MRQQQLLAVSFLRKMGFAEERPSMSVSYNDKDENQLLKK
jgi:hypothetical protein